MEDSKLQLTGQIRPNAYFCISLIEIKPFTLPLWRLRTTMAASPYAKSLSNPFLWSPSVGLTVYRFFFSNLGSGVVMITSFPNLFHFKVNGPSFWRTSTFRGQRQKPKTQGCHSVVMGFSLSLWFQEVLTYPRFLAAWPVDFKLQCQTQRLTETVKPALTTV